MEKNNFSYAKRKIIVIPIITLMIVVSVLTFVSAIMPTPPLQAYQTYIYDDYADALINNSLWTNSTTNVLVCNTGETANTMISASCLYGNFPSRSGTASITSNNLPPYNIIENITVYVEIQSHCGTTGCTSSTSQYTAFGVNIINWNLGGGFAIQTDNSIWTFKRNGTKFDVYNDGVFSSQITPINSVFYGTVSLTGQAADGGSGHVNIYILNYTMNDKIITVNSSYPLDNSIVGNGNITFNGTAITNSYGISTNSLTNMSLVIDGIVNQTVAITGTGVTNYSSFNVTDLPLGRHIWSMQACDNSSTCSNSVNRTVDISYLTVVNQSYSIPVYETSAQYFEINVQFNTALYPNAYGNLVYDGVVYTSNINKVVVGNDVKYSTYIDIPAITTTINKTFNWHLYSNPSTSQNTTITNQTVNPITFSLCGGAGGSHAFVDMVYLDENTLAPVNLSIISSSWNYWLGNGTTYKNYYYTSLTNASYNNSFCFTPASIPSTNLFSSIAYQYGLTGFYPTRTFQTTTPAYRIFINSSLTTINLYTLSYTESGSITIQVVDTSSGNVVPGAEILIQRNILGSLVTVFNGLTDSAGTVNVFLSTINSYTITASKAGCGINTQTVIPVGNYNMQLTCSGNLTKYVSQIQGVYYQRTPADGVTQPGLITYEYYVSSSTTPIISAMFILKDDQGTIVGTNVTYASSGYSWCTNVSCLLSIVYNTGSGENIKGSYYVNLGNTTNYTYVLLEGDAHWRFIIINSNLSQTGITRFADQFNSFFYQWEADGRCRVYLSSTSCAASGFCKWVNNTGYSVDVQLCVLKDDYNKAEFSRVLLIFFGMVLVLFIIGKTTGYEMTNPGSFVMFMTGAIIIMSILGFFRFNGATPNAFMDQYLYAAVCLCFSVGYNISIIRRYSA